MGADNLLLRQKRGYIALRFRRDRRQPGNALQFPVHVQLQRFVSPCTGRNRMRVLGSVPLETPSWLARHTVILNSPGPTRRGATGFFNHLEAISMDRR